MTTEAQLIAKIRDNPDDIDARLIYADWLEEQGDGRCEMIRAEVELSRHRGRLAEGELRTLERRQRMLWHRGEPMLDQLVALGASALWRDQYGLPYHVEISADDFLAKAARIGEIAPITEATIHVSDAHDLIRLSQSSELHHLHALVIDGETDHHRSANLNAGITRLCSSAHVRNLRLLAIRKGELNDNAAHFIAEAGPLSGVRKLDLASNLITDHGAFALARSSQLRGLRHINVQHNALTERGVLSLISERRLPDLETLKIEGNRVGAAVQWQVTRFNRGDSTRLR